MIGALPRLASRAVVVGKPEHVARFVDDGAGGPGVAGVFRQQDHVPKADGAVFIKRRIARRGFVAPPDRPPSRIGACEMDVDGIESAVLVGVESGQIFAFVKRSERFGHESFGVVRVVIPFVFGSVVERLTRKGKLSVRSPVVIGAEVFVGERGRSDGADPSCVLGPMMDWNTSSVSFSSN